MIKKTCLGYYKPDAATGFTMALERNIHRYTAFFRGWATAFGAHEKEADEDRGLIWLFGDGQLGLILTPAVKRFLYPLFLGRSQGDADHHQEHGQGDAPRVSLCSGLLRIDDTEIPFGDEDHRAFTVMTEMTRAAADLHLFQTYHLVYPSGTRILTLSRRAPLALIYHEIAPFPLELT